MKLEKIEEGFILSFLSYYTYLKRSSDKYPSFKKENSANLEFAETLLNEVFLENPYFINKIGNLQDRNLVYSDCTLTPQGIESVTVDPEDLHKDSLGTSIRTTKYLTALSNKGQSSMDKMVQHLRPSIFDMLSSAIANRIEQLPIPAQEQVKEVAAEEQLIQQVVSEVQEVVEQKTQVKAKRTKKV